MLFSMPFSRSRAPLVALLAALGLGCGGAQSGDAEPYYGGDVTVRASMEVLPSPELPREQWTERMRFAYLLAQQTFQLDPPIVPASASVDELQAWSDGELTGWLERKNAMVEAARAELDEAAEETHRQLIMAGALVGLMYEDVARVLLSVPMPSELRSEPEIAELYQDIIAFQAAPYVEHARRAYRACALNARQPAGMNHWTDFCAGRRDLLPIARGQRPENGTTVEVIRE